MKVEDRAFGAAVEAGVEADGGIGHLAGQGGAVLAVSVAALQADGERGGLAGCDADHDGVGRMAGEDFAAPFDAVGRELRGSDAGVEIERAPVAGGIRGAGSFDDQVAEGLVGLLVQRFAHELLHGEVFGFLLLSGPEQFADFGQRLGGALVGIVVGLARPDGTLVELYSFVRCAAEDHGAHAAVADGQGIGPENGRLVVPESEGGWAGRPRRPPRARMASATTVSFFINRKRAGRYPALQVYVE